MIFTLWLAGKTWIIYENLGKDVHKIQIWHDGAGLGADWRLESVRLQREEEDPLFFEIQRTLVANYIVESPANQEMKLVDYTITCDG